MIRLDGSNHYVLSIYKNRISVDNPILILDDKMTIRELYKKIEEIDMSYYFLNKKAFNLHQYTLLEELVRFKNGVPINEKIKILNNLHIKAEILMYSKTDNEESTIRCNCLNSKNEASSVVLEFNDGVMRIGKEKIIAHGYDELCFENLETIGGGTNEESNRDS